MMKLWDRGVDKNGVKGSKEKKFPKWEVVHMSTFPRWRQNKCIS